MDVTEKLSDSLQTDLSYLGITLGIAILFIAVGNLATPSEPSQVGFVEVETECHGLDIGICIGIQAENHITHNYDEYEQAEPGTENYYRLVESELMLQAYDICRENEVHGMEWTSEAEYDGQTGDEWLEDENVELLPCEHTYHRSIEDSS